MSIFKTVQQEKHNEIMKLNWHSKSVEDIQATIGLREDYQSQSKLGSNDYTPTDP